MKVSDAGLEQLIAGAGTGIRWLGIETALPLIRELLAARKVVKAAWVAVLSIDDAGDAELVAALSAYDKETA